jgi:hypothetical protein
MLVFRDIGCLTVTHATCILQNVERREIKLSGIIENVKNGNDQNISEDLVFQRIKRKKVECLVSIKDHQPVKTFYNG